ncbi:hypothetical protein DFH29DRAFT_1009522 [Suillus ampliporus]|nr:hypothetical protein DFH29DRAFT_1009522 [Suillus ampliporus]
MLIHLLQESVENNGKEVMVIPTAGDDLESLFYIFIKFATIFDGPCAKKRDKTEKPIWDGLFSLFGQNSWTSKMGLVLSHHSNMSLMSLTTPFFAPFQPIIQEWRHLILAADAASEVNAPPPPPPPSVSHEELAELLHKWLSQLPPEVPEDILSATALPVPIALSSRIARPSGPNNITQSTMGPHHSAHIQMKV